jgi:hypothetical protein
MNREFADYLESNERLLWTGQPKQGLVFRKTDLFFIPFSIFWCGFALFWTATAYWMTDGGWFALFGIPFVIIGLLMVFGRFAIDNRSRRNTFYGITNKRILIKKKSSFSAHDLISLSNLSFTERKDETGDITFGSGSESGRSSAARNQMMLLTGTQNPQQLQLVEKVATLFKLITKLKEEALKKQN